MIDTGDTTWVLISTAMVMLMTPGLAFFYGGMVRRKNVLATIMQSFVALCLVSIIWVLYGYSFVFGKDIFHFIGGFNFLGLIGVGGEPNADYSATIPHQAFMLFQMMFAIITPALITGAFAERFKFKTFLAFTAIWVTIVYLPIAHWVWGVGGWIRNMGALDFAGGLVVHISSGIAALATALYLGRRKGYGEEPMPPHNLTLTLIGAGLLWFGWFGFNGGSAVASGALATSAFVVTHIAAAAAGLSWMIMEWFTHKKPTTLGIASGAVAGLVAITPASGFVSPLASLVIGAVAGIVCFYAVGLKNFFKYDDSLDVVGIHGAGGIWGAIATGIFATTLVNAGGANGLFHGNPALLKVQLISIAAAVAYSFVLTLVILKVLDMTLGVRVTKQDEFIGLDISQHSENGYHLH